MMTSMRVLMIAPPGAGKGTQGALIAAHFHVPHIATGELLRDHVVRGTPLGQAVQAYLDRGELVPDQIVLDMVREAMIDAKAAGGGYAWTESRGTWSKPVPLTRSASSSG